MYDLVIRHGTVADGSGGPLFEGDVALESGRIAMVGHDVGRGREEIDARGLLVTPGWVDVHTHYDGQATWDPYLTPSGWHGVTTTVFGNCGVGFAPVRPDDHEVLIRLMEGVEDIPGIALAEGLTWNWESFPDYLDALAAMPRAIDVAAQVPHGAVRVYVMGARGARHERATPEDLAAMAAIVRDGVAAGALGFTSSRTYAHHTADRHYTPEHFAGEEELLAIGRGLKAAGRGTFGMVSDFEDEAAELAWMRHMAEQLGVPVWFLLLQGDREPERWRRLLQACRDSTGRIVPQVGSRPPGLMLGLQSTVHPFVSSPPYRAIAGLPLPERVARLAQPDLQAAVIDGIPAHRDEIMRQVTGAWEKMFPLGDEPDYEPAPEDSIAARARREGRRPAEVALAHMLRDGGRGVLFLPLLNYSYGDFEVLREMMTDPLTVVGLSDGGAHCGLICDSSVVTHMLTHWTRDRRRGERLPIEWAVKAQTADTADFFGLHDRGRIAPGRKADLNVIDYDGLQVGPLRMTHDLPAGGRRLVQRPTGYRYTLLNGQVTWRDGEPTGALPGALVRGPQPAPA